MADLAADLRGRLRGLDLRGIACWALAGAMAAWALSRLFGLEFGFPLVPLIAYTPYAALAAVLIAAGVALLRRWAPAAVAGLAALLLILLVAPRALPGPGPVGDPDGAEIHVMSTNLRVGHGDARTVVDLVRSHDVDVLSLQEMPVPARERLEAAGLRELLPNRMQVATPAGIEGSGIYTRLPVKQLPADSGAPGRVKGAVLTAPDGTRFDFVNVHPYVPTSWGAVRRWRDSFRDIPAADPEGELRIVAGDFNATLDTDELRDLIGTGYNDAADVRGEGLAPTFPAMGDKSLPVTIDHVLVDRRIGVDSYELEEVPGSDHRTVVVGLTLP